MKIKKGHHFKTHSDTEVIIQAYEEYGEDCLKYFSKLKELEVFDKISGAVVGFIYGMQVENPVGPQMENLLLEFTKDYDFPILKISDFGHNCPNTILPIGCRAEFDANKKKISILEKCVK